MNFLNLPNSKENAYFTIIFMEENSQNFNKITTFVPADKKVKHLKQFLQSVKINPFRNFFLTNKIKQKPQFTEEKDLRELKEECKKDKEGNYVLLCYEQRKDQAEIALTNKAAPPPAAAPPLKEEKKEDEGCLIM